MAEGVRLRDGVPDIEAEERASNGAEAGEGCKDKDQQRVCTSDDEGCLP